MAGHRPWRELYEKIPPERRAKIEADARADLERMLIDEVRAIAGLAPAEQADGENGSPDADSSEEIDIDTHISNLRSIAQALGAEVEIIVHLPAGRIAVSATGQRNQKAGAA
jgi:hypothetical protein